MSRGSRQREVERLVTCIGNGVGCIKECVLGHTTVESLCTHILMVGAISRTSKDYSKNVLCLLYGHYLTIHSNGGDMHSLCLILPSLWVSESVACRLQNPPNLYKRPYICNELFQSKPLALMNCPPKHLFQFFPRRITPQRQHIKASPCHRKSHRVITQT